MMAMRRPRRGRGHPAAARARLAPGLAAGLALRLAAAAVLTGAVPAAAAPPPVTPAPAAATSALPADARVLRIGYRLAVASAARCPRVRPLTGLALHDLASYDAADRARVAAAWRLGWGLGVLDVVPGGPADRAGLARGDEIVAAAGTPLADFARASVARRATPARVAAFEDWLAARLAAGPVPLVVRRGDATFTATLAGVPGCADGFVVDEDRYVDAWSDGHDVAVTSGLADLLPDDDALAFVIAHELSHNILGHAAAFAGRSRLLASFGIAAGRFSAAELAADRLGVTLTAGAGYDWHGAEQALRRIVGRRGDFGGGHPLLDTRLRAIRAVGDALPPATNAPAPPPRPGG